MVTRKDGKRFFDLRIEAAEARDRAVWSNARFALRRALRMLLPASLTLVLLIVTGCGGTIIKPATGAHEVDLEWSEPFDSPVPVAGYLVLRTPSGLSEYQQLNIYIVTSTTFVDHNVVSGKSYDYVVLSVDASGNTSAPSNIATASIP
jgi:hypothetical protein